VDVFKRNAGDILLGQYTSTLMDDVAAICPALTEIKQVSIRSIYNHYSVVEIEIAGYNVMSDLLQMMIPAALAQKPNAYQKQALKLLPKQYHVGGKATAYQKAMSVLDHVSAMTDVYATDLYRKIKGIEIGRHR
jgi:dGTPase